MTLLSGSVWSITDDDGTGQSGTIGDAAWVAAVKDSIEDLIHDSLNAGISPAEIIHDVVAARGALSSLDARLDVSLNEDGTLKTQAGLPTKAEVQSLAAALNIAINGDLNDWTAGGAAAPDGWVLSGAGGTIARTGPGMGDTGTFGTGLSGFAAKLTRVGADVKLTQAVIATADFANMANCKGQKVSVLMKAQSSIANHVRIAVNDGATQTQSAYHTGSGGVTEGSLTNVQTLTWTHTISGSATKLDVVVEVNGSNGDAYVGGIMIIFGDLAPTDWSALSYIPDANATRRGQVSASAQTFGGTKTFAVPPVGVPTFARCTATLTKNNSTSFSDVTGLAFAVGANEVWAFQVYMWLIGSNTAGQKFTLTGPSAPTAIRFGLTASHGTGANVTTSVAAFGSAIFALAQTADYTAVLSGLLRNGANAGTIQVQMAQVAAEVSDAKVYVESYLVAWRIS